MLYKAALYRHIGNIVAGRAPDLHKAALRPPQSSLSAVLMPNELA
jgi:hypothetical protein